MPIDFSEYVYLTPFDVSPTAVYLDALDYANLVLPEFQVRQGTPEDAILQAVSYITSLNVSAINRLPDRLMSGLVQMMGVTLIDGDKAYIDVLFTATTNEGAVIPQGTVVRYDYDFLGDRYSVYYETTEDATIAAVGDLDPLPTIVVEAASLRVGETLPLQVGTELQIETPTTDILSASVNASVSNGVNPESTGEYLTRAVNHLASLSSAFAKASQIDAFISSNYGGYVSRAKTYDLTNALGALNIGDADELGYVTIFVYGIKDFVSANQKTDILTEVQSRTVAGLEVDIVDVNIVDLELTADIGYSSSYESVTIETNVKNIVSSYFSPGNYRFANSIKLSEFYSIISSIPGVVYVNSASIVVSSPSLGSIDGDGNVNFVLKGSLPQVQIGSISLTLSAVS